MVSADPVSCALLNEARPRALRIVAVTTYDEVEPFLDSYSLPCGMAIDADVEAAEREAIMKIVRDRWHDLPALAMIRSSAPKALAVAHGVSDSWVFKSDDPTQQTRKMALFTRSALDAQLWRSARLLQQARAKQLSEATAGAFGALVLRMMPREVACARLGLSESGLEKRVGELCAAWGVSRIERLMVSLLGSVVKDAPPELVRELERQAEQDLEHEYTQRLLE